MPPHQNHMNSNGWQWNVCVCASGIKTVIILTNRWTQNFVFISTKAPRHYHCGSNAPHFDSVFNPLVHIIESDKLLPTMSPIDISNVIQWITSKIRFDKWKHYCEISLWVTEIDTFKTFILIALFFTKINSSRTKKNFPKKNRYTYLLEGWMTINSRQRIINQICYKKRKGDLIFCKLNTSLVEPSRKLFVKFMKLCQSNRIYNIACFRWCMRWQIVCYKFTLGKFDFSQPQLNGII